MSRIGKLPIDIPSGVTVSITGQKVTVKGKKGELHFQIHPVITARAEGNQVIVEKKRETQEAGALHGTTRAILNNMIEGVTNGYGKKLEIKGVGLRVAIAGKKMTFSLGFSHPIEFLIPAGISIKMDEENKNVMIIDGFDKQQVGEVAARIRGLRPPESYKGKGIRYFGERITLKQGKKAAK